ncbi:MAG: radical SAM/SPASM domain-containing protein [Bacteriovoracaceae bacterium]
MNSEELDFILYLKQLPEELLASNNFTLAEKQSMFTRMVRKVELEVNTFCNRKCSFCGNSFLDRFNKKEPMSWETYGVLLTDLKNINYSETLVFGRYSEPLASPRILEYVALARKELPKATISILSNGDYLTREYLESLSAAGLSRMSISLYPNMHEWNTENSRRMIETFCQRLELEALPFREHPESIHFSGKYKSLEVAVRATNILKFGHDRASSLPELTIPDFVRTSPCFMPIFTVNIDHDGKMLLCCNTRSDDPNHQDFVFGELKKENDLYHNFFNSHFLKWRKILLSGEAKPHPCSTCKQRDDLNANLYSKVGNQMEAKFSHSEKKKVT